MFSWKLGWDQTLNTWLHWLFRRTPPSSLSLLGQSEEGGDDAHVEVVVCPDAHDVVRILVISLNRTRMYLALRSFSTVKLKEKFLNLFFLNSSSNALTCSTVRCKSYSRSPDGQSLAAFLYSISFCVPLWSRLMWGPALVTVWNTILSLSSSLHPSFAHLSSSSWITSLKTPWAAGCWGPNLSWNYNVDVQYLTTLLFTCMFLTNFSGSSSLPVWGISWVLYCSSEKKKPSYSRFLVLGFLVSAKCDSQRFNAGHHKIQN